MNADERGSAYFIVLPNSFANWGIVIFRQLQNRNDPRSTRRNTNLACFVFLRVLRGS